MKHKWMQQQVGIKKPGGISCLSLHSTRTGEFTTYLAMKKLRKAALGYIATNLTRDEVGKLEEIFQAMDTNGDGQITLTEVDDAIAQGNFNANIVEGLQELRGDFAIDNEQKVNWKSFVSATMDRSVAVRSDNLKMAFDHFTHTDAEHLTLQDLVEIFEGAEAPAKEIINMLDTDGDGKVTYDEFCTAIAESMADDFDDEFA
jgi:calcium-dependent protein kinase